MSSRRSELKKNIDIFDKNHHTLLPKIISVSTFFWRNQTRSEDTFKMLIWTFFTESDWMHSLSTRSRLWRLVHFLLHFCAYWSFHNSTYDFFSSHETSDFMILLIKRRGLEKNIVYLNVVVVLTQYFFSILNSCSFLTK